MGLCAHWAHTIRSYPCVVTTRKDGTVRTYIDGWMSTRVVVIDPTDRFSNGEKTPIFRRSERNSRVSFSKRNDWMRTRERETETISRQRDRTFLTGPVPFICTGCSTAALCRLIIGFFILLLLLLVLWKIQHNTRATFLGGKKKIIIGYFTVRVVFCIF